ncbi:hypothetical protein FA158_11160 [Pseudomonas aeruginosa]|nr:hypothetical protein [Pseudomonas aeruginosa]
MTQTRRHFPKSFKREAVDQVLAGTPLRYVNETQGIAESLLGNCNQRGERAELRRLRQQLTHVIMESDVLKRRSPSSRST